MTITSLTKLSIGFLTLGMVGTTGYLGTQYLKGEKGKKISTLINQKFTHILLKTNGNDDSKYWEVAWKSYETARKKNEAGIFNLNEWKEDVDNNLILSLKEKCKELINLNISGIEDINYQNVAKFCSREVNINDQATKDGLRIIDENESAENQAIWKARESSKRDLDKELKVLGVVDGDELSKKIKEKCIETKNKKKSDSSYKTTYEAYKKVCIKRATEK